MTGRSGDRRRPRDGRIRIVVGDADIVGRIVHVIDPAADIGGRGERLEAVREARRVQTGR
ncbi:hypothetical protein [Nocardia nepalensis]|uniref:hypothetical protein n=1 Tax=Nocardia nepalensis TaxID=3375448 RepID=UPI003B66F372